MRDAKKRVLEKIAEENAVPEVLKRARRFLDRKQGNGEGLLCTIPNIVDWIAEFAKAELERKWIPVSVRPPDFIVAQVVRKDKPYYLVVDSKGRMSVAYPILCSWGIQWMSGKAIGEVTHYQLLPDQPEAQT